MKKVAFLALLAAASVVTSYPSSAAGATARVAGSLTIVQPLDAAPVATSAALTATRNEFESFQVVVSADAGAAISGLDVSTDGPLTVPAGQANAGAAIPASNVTIYREAYTRIFTPSDQELFCSSPLGFNPLSHPYCGIPVDGNLENTTWKCRASSPGIGDDRRCLFPDALIPKVDYIYGEARNAFPIKVPPGENRVAWIDVLVPKDAPAGTYQGRMRVSSTSGFSASVPVSLTVRDWTMPSPGTSPAHDLEGGIDMQGNTKPTCNAHPGYCSSSTVGFELTAAYARAGLENRTQTLGPSYLPPTAGTNRTDFDRYVRPLLTGGSPQNPAGTLKPLRQPGTKQTEVLLNQGTGASYAAAWKSAAVDGGFLPAVRFYCDEVMTQVTAGGLYDMQCDRPYRAAVSGWGTSPTLKVAQIGTQAQFNGARASSAFVADDNTDTLIPIIKDVQPWTSAAPYRGVNHRDSYTFANTPGNRMWMYHSNGSVGGGDGWTPHELWNGWPTLSGIDQPASQARAMAWQNFNYRTSGEYYFEAIKNNALVHAWNDCSLTTQCIYTEGGNGDGVVFYPGRHADPVISNFDGGPKVALGGTRDIPIESIRLKRTRDGHEDHALIKHVAGNCGGAGCVTPMTEQAVRNITGGPYASPAYSGLFAQANASTVSQSQLEAARERLLTAVPGAPAVSEPAPTPPAPTPPPPPAPAPAATCNGLAVTTTSTIGTAGNDVMLGTAGDDMIRGNGGDDTICGAGGFDTIAGGPGNDWIDGGIGPNALEFGFSATAVTVTGAMGTSTGEGTDSFRNVTEVYGSPAADTVTGGPTTTFIAGGAGNDVLASTSPGGTRIDGGDGADALTGGPGVDQLNCGNDVDRANADTADAAGADCEQVVRPVLLDTTAPTLRGVTVPATASTPTITVAIDAVDDRAVTQVRLATEDGNWRAWQPWAPTVSFTLSAGSGTKGVFVQVRDAAGNESTSTYRTLTYAPVLAPVPAPAPAPVVDTAPVLIAMSLPAVTATRQITVVLSATDDRGVTGVRLANENGAWGTWRPWSTKVSHTLTPKAMTKGVFAQVRDTAGKTSNVLFRTTLCSPCRDATVLGTATTTRATLSLTGARRSLSKASRKLLRSLTSGSDRTERLSLGAGAQHVNLAHADGRRDTVDCGGGYDTVLLRAEDRATNCERVVRVVQPVG